MFVQHWEWAKWQKATGSERQGEVRTCLERVKRLCGAVCEHACMRVSFIKDFHSEWKRYYGLYPDTYQNITDIESWNCEWCVRVCACLSNECNVSGEWWCSQAEFSFFPFPFLCGTWWNTVTSGSQMAHLVWLNFDTKSQGSALFECLRERKYCLFMFLCCNYMVKSNKQQIRNHVVWL